MFKKTKESQAKAENTKVRPPVGQTKAYNKKRNLYLLGLLMGVLLVFFFVSYARHYDNPIKNTEKTEVVFEERGSIEGKSPVVLVKSPTPYITGIDIEPGRYLVTTERGFGGFVVYEVGSNYPEISEMLGYFANPSYVPSVAVTLSDTQEIRLYGSKLSEVTFTPLETEFLTELSTGVWVVGLDILPGTYVVRSKDGRTGSLTLFDGDLPVARVSLGVGGKTITDDEYFSGGEEFINAFLDDEEYEGEEPLPGENTFTTGEVFKGYETITLKEGEIIRISNIPTVVFELVTTTNHPQYQNNLFSEA